MYHNFRNLSELSEAAITKRFSILDDANAEMIECVLRHSRN
jgi:hypothetical protein